MQTITTIAKHLVGSSCIAFVALAGSTASSEAFQERWAARQIYMERCASCHGSDRMGYIGIPLTPSYLRELSEAAIRALIRHGIEETLMPAWSCRLTQGRLRALSHYLKTDPPETQRRIVTKAAGKVEFSEYQPWWRQRERTQEGRSLFTEYCIGCHHPTYEAFAPSYSEVASKRDIRAIVGQIKFPYTSSRILEYREQIMPKFELTDDQIKSLGVFVFAFRSPQGE